MLRYKFLRYLVLGSLFCFVTACNQSHNQEGERYGEYLVNNDSIPLPSKVQNIAGRNIEIFFIDPASVIRDSLVNKRKELRISGDVFLKIDGNEFPVYIYTSLMEMKVLQPSVFRITAYDKDQGQSVESLHGEIKISKNYSSPFPDPDTLRKDNLYMVNSSIDLSEKENLDDDKLAEWWERVDNK